MLLFNRSVVSDSLGPHGQQHTRLPCPTLSPGVCSNSCPWSHWCHPTISPSVTPSPPAPNLPQLRVLPSKSALYIRWSIGASASVLPMKIQDWFPLGLTDLIFLQSKGHSRFSLAPQFEGINSWALSLLYVTTHICTWLLEKFRLLVLSMILVFHRLPWSD